ncbi:MAG: hypothetical protein KGQ49_02430 [Verrucomicrobia bacterium]|nr:hypothetical protein [Verrucomicrobiota bacterium]MBU6446238.1 hypothetical protein [Verrucomicrobiota bacterium]MDE3046916.1 class I SAM-dependent RNA methyltransferase [Verrucomicrobiota bacterium]
MNKPSACPHFAQCSGCELPDPYNPPIWQEILTFFREQGVEPELITDGFSQTRMKAKLAIRPGPNLGLFKKGTHEVIAIPQCLVHHPSINRAALLLKEEIIKHNIPPFDERSGKGVLRYAQMFVERTTGLVQLALVATQPIDPFCRALLKRGPWHSIWQNIHSAPNNAIFGSTWKLQAGAPFLWQPIGAHTFPFHPAAFSQAHFPLFEKMIRKIGDWVGSDSKILELYAGVGVIGLSLPYQALTLVESNPFAYFSFQQMKRDVPYFCVDAKKASFSGYDVTIVDPPRKGLDPEIIPQIASQKLIYVSCQFSSFRRDAMRFFELGWKLRKGAGYLLFPGANHVEVVAELILPFKPGFAES